ncbi:glycosyltransferase [Candidatus Borrarchaeum sp.]|uniref:glycosyltransferase n=1 Tax=Candidatus Borrarchaeum sp. TaxID=2846742 RepID=UPI002579891A|nr:glycosyltransferase [Candidatus Borrarchaeum sp.]
MASLKNYRSIVGIEHFEQLQMKSEKFSKYHILCINSTYQGGGVAEMLNSMIPMFHDFGIDFGWRILHGNPDFFKVTKSYHNGLQGDKVNLSERRKKIYYETNKRFSKFTHINNHDLVIVHDPQPLALVDFYEKKQPWIFRAHIDITHPNPTHWTYLKNFIEQYDHLVISMEKYKKELNIPQSVIYPAIDPLCQKNKKISDKMIDSTLTKHGINIERPIISQVSRFDKWKDPLGVIRVFEMVRQKLDCQLVLLGAFATDDPEGQQIYEKVRKKVNKSTYKKDIKLLLNGTDLMVNCLQTASSVVIQKSLREGFGLVVSEALWKDTPVVASNVGGIPLQVINGMNGFLHEPKDIKGFSESIIKLLKDEKLRDEMGKNGKEHVKNNFLITRLMIDWLNIFENYLD